MPPTDARVMRAIAPAATIAIIISIKKNKKLRVLKNPP
jgi:hypothetical protein